MECPPLVGADGAREVGGQDRRTAWRLEMVERSWYRRSYYSAARRSASSQSGFQQVGAIALLIHVAQLLTDLTGESDRTDSDFTVRTLASPDYEGTVAVLRSFASSLKTAPSARNFRHRPQGPPCAFTAASPSAPGQQRQSQRPLDGPGPYAAPAL
jgi:hypothetical protein